MKTLFIALLLTATTVSAYDWQEERQQEEYIQEQQLWELREHNQNLQQQQDDWQYQRDRERIEDILLDQDNPYRTYR